MLLYDLFESHSKVGRIVYHGSNARFDKFDQKQSRIVNDFYGGGVAYFTDNMDVAKTYAKAMFRSRGGGQFVYKVELTLKNVFDVDDTFTKSELTKFFNEKNIEDFARGAGLLKIGEDRYDVMTKLSMGNMTLTGDQIFKGLSRGMNHTALARQMLIKLGYDGLRHNGGVNMNMAIKHNVYLAYHAKDIFIQNVYQVKDNTLVSETLLTEDVTETKDLMAIADYLATWMRNDNGENEAVQLTIRDIRSITRVQIPQIESEHVWHMLADDLRFTYNNPDFTEGNAFGAYFAPPQPVININLALIQKRGQSLASILLHELQHAADDYKSQGNALASNPYPASIEQNRKAYMAHPLEINARFSQALWDIASNYEVLMRSNVYNAITQALKEHKLSPEMFKTPNEYKRLITRAYKFLIEVIEIKKDLPKDEPKASFAQKVKALIRKWLP